MWRYGIALAVMALLIGSLFRAADQTGAGLMKMFGTLGIFLFGVGGTLALNRWQTRAGLREIERALKSLEPEWLITDWAYQGEGRPDYLLVGPGGIVAVCLEDVAQSARVRSAAARVARGRERVAGAVGWVRERLQSPASRLTPSLGDRAGALPVAGVLVLTRRRAVAEYTTPEAPVLNPDQVPAHIRSLWAEQLLDESARIRLTRLFREP